MSRFRFIVAEKANCLGRPPVPRAGCVDQWLLRLAAAPAQRTHARTDAALSERIRARSRGQPLHVRRATGPCRAARDRHARRQEAGRAPDAHGWAGRSLPETLSTDDDPVGTPSSSAADLVRRDFRRRRPIACGSPTSPTCAPGRAGCTWPSSWTRSAAAWWAGRSPTICAPSSPPMRCTWR